MEVYPPREPDAKRTISSRRDDGRSQGVCHFTPMGYNQQRNAGGATLKSVVWTVHRRASTPISAVERDGRNQQEGDVGILEALGLKKKAAPPSGKTIKVGPRDTLKSIAKREYGDENLWTKIYEANKWRIDGDEVAPGQDLFIPDASSG